MLRRDRSSRSAGTGGCGGNVSRAQNDPPPSRNRASTGPNKRLINYSASKLNLAMSRPFGPSIILNGA